MRPRFELEASTNYKYMLDEGSYTKVSVMKDGVWAENERRIVESEAANPTFAPTLQ
jgi:hypothetical protein